MVKQFGPSKYKYVNKVNRNRHGKKINKWMGRIPIYRHGTAWGSKLYDTEREAAIAVDMAFLRIGKKPVNILKLVKSDLRELAPEKQPTYGRNRPN